MKKLCKAPPHITLVVILACSLWLNPVIASAGVVDNTGSSAAVSLIGQPAENSSDTLFGLLYNILSKLDTLNTLATQDQVTELSRQIGSIKTNVDVAASQTYVQFLNDFIANGKSSSVYNDATLWASLCQSSVMMRNPLYNMYSYDYYVSNNLDLAEFFSIVTNSTQFDTIHNRDQLYASDTHLNIIAGNPLLRNSIINDKDICVKILNNSSYCSLYMQDNNSLIALSRSDACHSYTEVFLNNNAQVVYSTIQQNIGTWDTTSLDTDFASGSFSGTVGNAENGLCFITIYNYHWSSGWGGASFSSPIGNTLYSCGGTNAADYTWNFYTCSYNNVNYYVNSHGGYQYFRGTKYKPK